MADGLITLSKNGFSEITEKKSIFIATAIPIVSEQEAIDHIVSVKKKYPDARHTVYAYILSDKGTARYSDDGEPQGTAGLPILDFMKKSGFDNACITVTRYFGGILLGTGGLVRAYTQAAALAVSDAGLAEWKKHDVFRLAMSYQDFSKLTSFLDQYKQLNLSFEENVVYEIAVAQGLSDSFTNAVSDRTSGRVFPEFVKSVLIKSEKN